jgi:hypothetical protein
LAESYHVLGRNREALATYQKAIDFCKSNDDLEGWRNSLMELSSYYLSEAQPLKSLECCNEMVKLTDEILKTPKGKANSDAKYQWLLRSCDIRIREAQSNMALKRFEEASQCLNFVSDGIPKLFAFGGNIEPWQGTPTAAKYVQPSKNWKKVDLDPITKAYDDCKIQLDNLIAAQAAKQHTR